MEYTDVLLEVYSDVIELHNTVTLAKNRLLKLYPKKAHVIHEIMDDVRKELLEFRENKKIKRHSHLMEIIIRNVSWNPMEEHFYGKIPLTRMHVEEGIIAYVEEKVIGWFSKLLNKKHGYSRLSTS